MNVKKMLLILLCFLIFPHLVNAQKPLTHEIMVKLKKVGPSQISPNGQWLIYSQVETSYNLDEQTTDLWLASADGKVVPRKITSTKTAEDNYFWNQDGSKIYFTTKREGDEVAQLYVLAMDGGEAQRLTQLSTSVSGAKLSSDGSLIAFTSRVFPLAFTDSLSKKRAEEYKKIKYKARVYTSFPIRYWDSWLDEKQDHLFILSTKMGSLPKNIFNDVTIINSKGFRLGNFTFAPGGKSIVFSAMVDYNTSAFQSPKSNLYELSVQGGKEKQLTFDAYDYTRADFTNDGKFLIAAVSENGNKLYYLTRLFRYSWPNLIDKFELAPTLDRAFNDYLTVGSEVLASVEDQGVDRIVKINVGSGLVSNVIGGEMGSYTAISSNSLDEFTYTFQHMGAPPEVWAYKNGAILPISKSNDRVLAGLDVPRPEVIWTLTSRVKKIKSLVLRPSNFDSKKKYPLFVLMHGGPAISFKDVFGSRWNPNVLASTDYVIVMTDYTGSVGYGERFTQDIQFDPFRGPGQEILEGAADAIKRFSFIDATKQAAGGASYGGHLANWMQATTSHFKCLIAHAGLVNSEAQWGTSDVIWGRELMNGAAPWVPTKTWKEQNPMRFASNFKTPMLLTVGENDFRVPINNTLENWSILQRLQIPSKLIVFPGENHWILNPENSKFHYQSIADWLGQYLK